MPSFACEGTRLAPQLGVRNLLRTWRINLVCTALLTGFVCASPAAAQDTTPPSFAGSVIKGVLLDPTTYAPSLLSYTSLRLDWNSSQVFFQNGSFEHNPAYTISGRPDDLPVTYGEGNRRILRESLGVLQASIVNNVSNRVIEQVLVRKYPEHRKLWKALGWAERIAVASYFSYQSSYLHFRQWQVNNEAAGQLGYR
jgi:hypothetical protein